MGIVLVYKIVWSTITGKFFFYNKEDVFWMYNVIFCLLNVIINTYLSTILTRFFIQEFGTINDGCESRSFDLVIRQESARLPVWWIIHAHCLKQNTPRGYAFNRINEMLNSALCVLLRNSKKFIVIVKMGLDFRNEKYY